MYKNRFNLGLRKENNNKRKKTSKPVGFLGAMDVEASSSHRASSPPPNSTSIASSATSKYLSNLPSRGLFSSPVITTNPGYPEILLYFDCEREWLAQGSLRVYICDHDTSPPEDQQIKTNPTNILIRSLVKKQKSDSSSKVVKDSGARKRGAEKALEGRPKRAITDGSSTTSPAKNLISLTVERLRALLKEKGLSPRGKKEELIARLKNG